MKIIVFGSGILISLFGCSEVQTNIDITCAVVKHEPIKGPACSNYSVPSNAGELISAETKRVKQQKECVAPTPSEYFLYNSSDIDLHDVTILQKYIYADATKKTNKAVFQGRWQSNDIQNGGALFPRGHSKTLEGETKHPEKIETFIKAKEGIASHELYDVSQCEEIVVRVKE